MLSLISLIAIAIIVGAIVLGWSKRFLAVGSLALANIAVFAMTAFGPYKLSTCGPQRYFSPVIHQELGLCADDLYARKPIALLEAFTSMFVHADFGHLFGNLLILLAFALVFEELIGPRKFLILYLGSGLIAALGQVLANLGQPMLLIGASGAVFGIIGAFAGSYPNMVMRLPIPLPILIFVRMKVIVAAALFGIAQVVLTLFSSVSSLGGRVAYAAHLAGLAAGFAFALLLVRPGIERPGNPVKLKTDLDALARFATDASTRRAYDEMVANRDEPEVFKAWVERFWQGAKDPVTGAKVRPGPKGSVVLEDGSPVAPA
jgi:membrane associated rhomboid family serine protease